jgi:hypothetical protein
MEFHAEIKSYPPTAHTSRSTLYYTLSVSYTSVIILNIHWPEVISNEELWRRAEETEISIQIKRRKWN